MKCPRCKGTGTILTHPSGGFGLNPGNRMDERPCYVCGGSGHLPDTPDTDE
jgi:DnaJ-class molecular chaperone